MPACEMKYVEGLINKMRVIHRTPPPPTLGSESRQQTLSGPRVPGSPAPRLFSPGSLGAAASLLLKKRLTPTFLVLLTALVAGLLFLLPGGLLHAQNDGTIEYPENGMDAVATFTATDPEDQMVYWSLLEALPNPVPTVDGTELAATDLEDFGHFTISSDGVLSFNIPPDHEMPAGGSDGDSNTYMVVVVASDDAPDSTSARQTDNPIMMGYKRVVITVTDVDEPGMVSLSSLQPQVGADLTATLADPELTDTELIDINADAQTVDEWKWEKSQDMSSWEAIDGAGGGNAYGPDSSTEGYYLRATATYDDADDNERTAMAVSANRVRAAPTTTDGAATFPSGSGTRSVDENSPAETEVGKPVAADDTSDEVLTYSLTGANNSGGFRIDPATGQITVGPRAMLDHETTASYDVTVSVIGAGGVSAVTQAVTIMVNDVNEAPTVTAGVTMMEHMEDDADIDTDDITVLTVSTYAATDPEDATADLTFSLKGADADKLSIDESSGVLTFEEAPNYEMPADAGRNNVYNVTVVATDDGTGKGNKMTAERMVVIMVTNVEEDGTVELSAQQPKIGVEVTASVTDLDGAPTDVTWEWQRDDNQGTEDAPSTTGVEIKGATMAAYTPTKDDEGKYLRAIASYTDGKGKDTSMATSAAVVAVRTDNPPEFPKTEGGKRYIVEGGTGEVRANSDGTTEGTGEAPDPVRAMDAETDQLLTYSLSGTDASSFTIDSDTTTNDADRGGQISVASGVKLDYEIKNSYMVTVTATDPDNLSDSIAVTIMVTDMDEAPMITGDAKKDYQENGTRMVARYTADDPEDRMVYWSLLEELPNPVPTVDGTELATTDLEDFGHFTISSDGVLSFNIPPDHEMPAGGSDGDSNTYMVVVVASDDAPDSTSARQTDNPIMMGYKRVVITVTDVDEPGMVSLSSLQPQVGADLTATLAAPEQHETTATITWKWEKSRSRSSGWTAIDGAGETETYQPTAAIGYLRATATYTDSDNEERTAHGVSVNRVRTAPTTTDEAATFPSGSGTRSVDENSPAETEVGKPVAADDTSDEVLTYSLTGANNSGGFRIDPATGQITVGPRAMLDHETTASYDVTVSVIGAGGVSAVTQAVTIMVNDVNEAPTVTAGVTMMEHMEDDADIDTDDITVLTVSTYAATDPEDATADLTFSLKGADADKLSIDESSGVLTFEEAPNYEMPADAGRNNVYNVTVVATDDGTGKGNKMTAERMVVIMVTNVEEDGTVELSAQQPKIGVEVTASVTDLDGAPTDVTWEWQRDDNQGTEDAPSTTGVEIKGATMAAYTPTKDDEGKYLRAIASYTDGKGKDTSMATSAAVVAVRTDNPPEFPKTEGGKRYIVEGGTGEVRANSDGTTEGTGEAPDPVRAMDAETDQLLTYSLSGTDASSFTIDSDTTTNDADRGGQISVASGVKLDYEIKNSYMVTVTATDPDGLSASIGVTIMVTDMDEAPEIMRAPDANVAPKFASATITRTVAENTAAGEDIGNPVEATDANNDTLIYVLGGTDAASFAIDSATGQLSTRAALDYETKSSYSVTVTATDPDGESATARVTITVTDVEEAPDTLMTRYDKNGNGKIDRGEVLDGIDDFFDPAVAITRNEVLDLIDLFFEGLGS